MLSGAGYGSYAGCRELWVMCISFGCRTSDGTRQSAHRAAGYIRALALARGRWTTNGRIVRSVQIWQGIRIEKYKEFFSFFFFNAQPFFNHWEFVKFASARSSSVEPTERPLFNIRSEMALRLRVARWRKDHDVCRMACIRLHSRIFGVQISSRVIFFYNRLCDFYSLFHSQL